MPAKKSVPAPIDRPLSKAYLRQFTGWSTAYPPGLSDPASCRDMQNVMVDRSKGISVRPGLRYVSYIDTPDMHYDDVAAPGVAFDRPVVGTMEPFYLHDGSKALLFACREEDDTVGFRAMLLTDPNQIVYTITDTKIGFYIPQGVATLNFSSATKHVSYLQIDNKIMALSDAGESVRLFSVGAEKVAKRMNAITTPEWEDAHKAVVMHPEAAWISKLGYTVRRNELINPSFEAGTAGWTKGSTTSWEITRAESLPAGGTSLKVWTAPQRTNLATSPLHNVSATGIEGWHSGLGNPVLRAVGDDMRIYDEKGTNVFLARSAKLAGIEAGRKYRVAFDFDLSADALLRVRLQFYRNNGSEIGDPIKFFPDERSGRYVTPAIEAPSNAVTARIFVGGDSTKKKQSWVKVRNVMLCRANESTDMFSGASGAGYYWTGTANQSTSVYWPNQDITIVAARVSVTPGRPVTNTMHVKALSGVAKTTDLQLFLYDQHRTQLESGVTSASSGTGAWTRISVSSESGIAPTNSVAAGLQITIRDVGPNQVFALDGGMIESDASTAGTYFDGSTVSTTQLVHQWENPGAAHLCPSIQIRTVDPTAIPTAETPAANTVIANGSSSADVNKYKMGYFYTFENEIGESAPSKITEVRMKRPQSNWLWEVPNAAGEPSGTATEVADLCADQLVAVVPSSVYTEALSAGAIKWNLYTFSWSDQDPVPVEAQFAGSRELYPDQASRLSGNSLPYEKGGWINVTPSRRFTLDSAMLPTKDNRTNYSQPPRARTGIVAADRIVLVGDADDPGAIRWSSNRPGEYTKFTAGKGGGVKTLSSGNLHLPGAVVLWQNPQSVDTLTILCLGSDGTSICYYMTPADINAQTGSTQVMGFEETTNTPGTMAPYGALVHNNALYRPIDRSLLKSTAQNYNINHKSMSDDISNMWESLQSKNWIMSAVHDNRLYFLVNNPRGVPVEDGCHGNEIWVYDTVGKESGTWSRFLIQASGLRILEYGPRVYVGVMRPDGVYYLDPDARQDDYVMEDGNVGQRPIPWFFETNTQGANRAHDAWAHLQQVSVMFGDFSGAMRYGIRGRTVNGQNVSIEKQFEDLTPDRSTLMSWDVEDHLLVRRDMKEWYFFAGNVDGKAGSGSICHVQYRYTPVTVNVGYEYGSIETFEYGRNVLEGADVYSTNGIPRPVQDMEWERT